MVLLLALGATERLSAAEKKKSGITVDMGDGRVAPADVDARYTPQALREAFQAVCKKLHYRIERLEVDATEFPFLVHGVLDKGDHREIRDALNAMPGYTYVGSVTLNTSDGPTLFALNMTPQDQYPRDRATQERIRERLNALARSWR